jgi:hexosaminidase
VQVQDAPSDLYDAVTQAQYYLENDKLGRLVVGRGANDTTALASAKTLSCLTLSLTSGTSAEPIASEAVKPLGTRSEEYALMIPADSSTATLTANSTLGLYRGLTTFNQLFYYYGGVTYTLIAPVAITDTPAYVSTYRIHYKASPFKLMCIAFPRTWAGYIKELLPRRWHLANVGRHELGQGKSFPAVSCCYHWRARQINTFHWHITDSQSFPLEVAQYPELAINGAYSPEEVYTESDIQYIVQYAGAVRTYFYHNLLCLY